jgi:Fic family protein
MADFYTAPHQFEPLMPRESVSAALAELAYDLSQEARDLAGKPLPTELRQLLRGMNSYYSNRIEGQHTRPLEIAQALRQDFAQDARLASRQRLALAHMDVEAWAEQQFTGAAGVAALWQPSAVQALHEALYTRLPEADRISDEGEAITPGAWRVREVKVGRHVAPQAATVPAFLARWAQVYGAVRRGEMALLAVAAAHHRLGWVHPFTDGNGRVMRLHTHALLHAMGLSCGAWSPLRGFARAHGEYYRLLAEADEPRQGDLDGRGNLSERTLVAWMAFVLNLCLDQVRFMKDMLDLDRFESRLAACLQFEQTERKSGVRIEARRPLHYLFLSGQSLERGEFKTMMGLGERVATATLSALVQRGLLVSDSPQGRVRFGVPMHALRFLFPALWPEAEADAVGL